MEKHHIKPLGQAKQHSEAVMFECRNCGDPCTTEGGQCRGCGQSRFSTYEKSDAGMLVICRLCDWRDLRSTRAAAQRAFTRHWYPAHREERPVPLRNGTLVAFDRALSKWLAAHEAGPEPVTYYCLEPECDNIVSRAGVRCRDHAK